MPHTILLATLFAFGFPAADESKAEMPDDAVRRIVEVSKVGDVDGFFDILTSEYGAAMRAQYDADVAKDKFVEALDEKFGKSGGGTRGADAFKNEIMGLRNMEVLEKAAKGQEKVVMKVKVTTRGKDGEDNSKVVEWIGIKEVGGWKLLPPTAPDAKTIEAVRTAANRARAIADRVREEVKEGKYKSREEAEKAYRKLL